MDLINIKRENARTPILDAQGKLTLWSKVKSGRIPNSYKLLCMSSLTADKNGSTVFFHYKSMRIFSDALGQLTP